MVVVSKDKKKQFDILKQLMNAPDVTEVVNACDAGREGVRSSAASTSLAGCQKPMKRLWISSMEDSAIREGFANLRPGTDYDGREMCSLPRQGGLAGGYQRHPVVFRAVSPNLNIGRVMSRRWPSSFSGRPRSTPSSRCRSTRSH